MRTFEFTILCACMVGRWRCRVVTHIYCHGVGGSWRSSKTVNVFIWIHFEIVEDLSDFSNIHFLTKSGFEKRFDESIATHLGPAATVQDFPAENLTPDPDHFDDSNPIDPDYGAAETTPEMGDNYLSAEIMLPCGGTMVKGRVAARKHDRDGNPIGLANVNPILDT